MFIEYPFLILKSELSVYLFFSVIRCPFLEEPENGNRSVSGYLPGDNATFMCNEDFVMLQGHKIRYCTVNGSWTGAEVICVKPTGE